MADLLTARSIESYSPFQVIPPDLDEDSYRLKRQRWVDLLHIGYLLDRKVIHLSHGESRQAADRPPADAVAQAAHPG